jgi:hypothetical protein
VWVWVSVGTDPCSCPHAAGKHASLGGRLLGWPSRLPPLLQLLLLRPPPAPLPPCSSTPTRLPRCLPCPLPPPAERVVTNLAQYGNTSAASIPLALDEAVRRGDIKEGEVLAMAGFGAGLSWASAIVRWG